MPNPTKKVQIVGEVLKSFVRNDIAQELTDEQKVQAKVNIGAEDEVYILQDGETDANAPDTAVILIDSTESEFDGELSGGAYVEIANNLTTSDPRMVLSAAQGVVLKGLVDELEQSVDGKVDASHSHVISDVTDLQTNLDAINDTLEQKSQVQVVVEGSSEILPTLMIHKLTQEEYDQEVANGTIDTNAIYLTPEEEIDLSNYVTIEQLESKADSTHNHDSAYDTKGSADNALASAKEYTDTKVSGLTSASHTHDDRYYTETEIDTKIDEINESINSKVDSSILSNYSTTDESQDYTDNAVAQKTQVQIITWEDDD